MIKPTIGRVVLVHRGQSAQAEPALICYVHSDRCINVGGFDCNGNPFAATSLQLLQDDETPTNLNYYAEWMPYQVAQAAKEVPAITVVEQEIQAKGLTAPRITPADIEANIVSDEYAVFGSRLTVCVLTLCNGYLVTGESSCVSAENFDAELGRKYAREKAFDKVGELMGYALRSKLQAG